MDRVPPVFPDGIRPAEASELLGTWVLPGETGGEGDWPLVGFSPRKQNLTLYLGSNHDRDLLEKLGKFKTSVACLYINKLADVDRGVLAELIARSFRFHKKKLNGKKGP